MSPRLLEYAAQGLWRERRVVEQRDGIMVKLQDKWVVNFCSNDYLGLSVHPEVLNALQETAKQYGVGSGGSAVVSGYCYAHEMLEKAFADFLGYERALLFSAGYLANLGVITGLTTEKTVIFSDKSVHASLIDAIQLSSAKHCRFSHGDIAHFITRTQGQTLDPSAINCLITEGIFSMSGAWVDLPAFVAIAKKANLLCIVDDAHGIGVLGEQGRGTLSHLKLSAKEIDVLVVPMGKALGCGGAVVLGSHELIETILQFARPYTYSTALSPAVAGAARTALKILQTEESLRAHLSELIAFFRETAKQQGLALYSSETAIQIIEIGDSVKCVALQKYLLTHGFWVGAIRPPTVPRNTARLRIGLSTLHTQQQIRSLLAAMKYCDA